jgi:hypothetical protein
MTEKEWLSFHSAAQEIERIKGVSRGKAQSILRQLCATGEVRSVKEPYSIVNNEPQGEGPPERIEPSEWRNRDIDLMTDSDGCRYLVDVSEADLRHWLGKPEPKRQSPARKRDIALEAINATFGNTILPNIPNSQIEKQAGEWLKQNGRLTSATTPSYEPQAARSKGNEGIA